MRQEKQKEVQSRHPTGTDAEFTQYMAGDGATGGNAAYGNAAGNQGARLAAAVPEEGRIGNQGARLADAGPEKDQTGSK